MLIFRPSSTRSSFYSLDRSAFQYYIIEQFWWSKWIIFVSSLPFHAVGNMRASETRRFILLYGQELHSHGVIVKTTTSTKLFENSRRLTSHFCIISIYFVCIIRSLSFNGPRTLLMCFSYLTPGNILHGEWALPMRQEAKFRIFYESTNHP